MRKSIARKLAGLLAIVVMTTTFASDYNSIGARASEENAIEAETLETATDAEASEESEVVEDSQEVTEEAEEVVEEVSETTEDSEEAAEAEEQTEEAAEPAEDAEETSTEGSEEVASEETPAEETPAEETPAEDAAAEETAEDVSVVNITYTAGVGGTVSIESEQVTDAAAGATATADDGYKFVNWTNEDEVIVSEDATFTPSGDQLVDGAVYYANFMKAEKEFRCEKEIDGIKITLFADKGVLPSDVELNIVKVENEVEEQITELLDEKTGDDVEVAKTYSYDITFKAESAKTEENPEGIVQPEDDKTVEIKFSQIEEAASADTELAVYHVEDDISDADIVAEADSKTATDVVVNAEHFSIYSVVLYEDHLVNKDHKYPVKISVVDELGNDITGDKNVTIYLDREHLYNDHYYISTADAANEMVNFVDNQIFTFVGATCNGDEFDRFNKADGDNKVELYNGNQFVANLDAVKNSGITFEYAHVTTDHLDFGFMDPEEYNYYKNNEAVITAQISDGDPITMYPTEQDADIKSYEYRAYLYNYKYGADQYAIATETIKFTITIGDQVFEKTTTTKDNAEAAERCYTNHKKHKQEAYGFDYVFSFADDFKLKGDVVYHKNDGTEVKWADTVNFGWNTTKEDYSVLSIDTIANKESAPEQFNVYADHVFKGWGTKDASGKINLVYAYNNGKFTPASCEVTKDCTLDLYAVWEEDSYTVTYKTDKPGTFAEQTKKAIKNTTTPAFEGEKTSENGYEFVGWDDASTQEVEKYSDAELANKTVTGNVTYVAQWKGSEAEYTIKVYLGVSGKYADPVSYKNTDKLPDNDKKTVEDHYGKAYVGEKFAPKFDDTYGDYSLVKNKGKLVLDKVSAVSEKNVLEVYYNVEYPKVSFYVLKPGKSIPADSKGKDVKDYFPEKDNADYPYDKWSGLAVDLYSLPESQLDTNHNLWAYNSETGIISDAITEATVIKSVPKETINADLKDCLNVKVLAQNGEVRDATYDDIQWYVYKNTSGDHYKGGDKSYHIDGYIKGVLINVTYHSNYGNEYTAVDKARTGEKYSVKGTTVGNTTFEREGYTFVGWNTQKDGKGTTYKETDLTPVLMASTDFYAMWKPVDYKTTYLDEDKTTLLGDKKQHYDETTFTLTADPTKEGYEFTGWVKKDDVTDTKYLTADIKKTKVKGDVTYIATYKQVIFKAYYKVEYYYQNKSGEKFIKDKKVRTGTVDVRDNEEVEVSVTEDDKSKTTYKNYTYVLSSNDESWKVKVSKNNSSKKKAAVLKVYYVREHAGIQLILKAGSATKYYDGTPLNSNEIIVSALDKDGNDISNNYEVVYADNNGGEANANEKPSVNKIKAFAVKNVKNGEVYCYNYNKISGAKKVEFKKGKNTCDIADDKFEVSKITIYNGELQVMPRPVTITVPGADKYFDGLSYDPASYDKEITYEFFLTEEEKKIPGALSKIVFNNLKPEIPSDVVSVADSAKSSEEIGLASNYFVTVNGEPLKEKYKKSNFEITVVNGDLVIKPVTTTITIPSAEKVYNGKAFSNEEYSAFLTANGTKVGYTNLPEGLSFENNTVKVKLPTDYKDVIYDATYDVASWNKDVVTVDTTATQIVNKAGKSVKYAVVTGEETSDADLVVYVAPGSLRILRRNVTLTSKTLTKEFELGVPLTADERVKAGETDAKEITANEYKDYTVDGYVKGDGFVEGEGLDTEKTKFTGERVDVGGTDEKENTFEYELKDNTKATNYKITSEYGDLVVTKRDPEHKYKIKIALSAQTDEAGRDTTVYYSGVEQKANMKVDVTVDTHQITDAITDSDVFAGLSGAVKNALNAAVGSIKAHAEEGFVLPDGAVLIPEHNETINDKMSVRISQLYLTGGAGTDAGDYPIFLHESNMKIELLYDGKAFDLSDEFEIEIEKDGQKVTTDDAATLAADGEDETVVEDKTDIIGYLHVLKKDVVLTSASATKVYDGTPLTAPTVTASENTEKTGFVEGEGAAYNVTGTITEPGTVSNTFTYALQENTLAANYNISTEEGTLTVTKQTEENPPEEDDKKDDKKDNKKDKKEKKESTNNAPFDDSSYDDSSNDSANSAPANNGEVLGVNREADGQGEEAAVLGARRAGTEDSTNSARVIVILIAAGAVASILAVSRKKKEDKKN